MYYTEVVHIFYFTYVSFPYTSLNNCLSYWITSYVRHPSLIVQLWSPVEQCHRWLEGASYVRHREGKPSNLALRRLTTITSWINSPVYMSTVIAHAYNLSLDWHNTIASTAIANESYKDDISDEKISSGAASYISAPLNLPPTLPLLLPTNQGPISRYQGTPCECRIALSIHSQICVSSHC